MSSFRRHVLLGMATAIATVTAVFVVAPDVAAEPTTAIHADLTLVARERSHDFGRVNQGAILHHRFELVNRTDHRIEFRSVEPQCTCTTVDEWPRALEPGQSGTVALTVETARFAGPISKAVHIMSSEPNILVLEVKADVWTPLAVTTSTVIFPAVTDPTQPAMRTVTIRNQRPSAVTLGRPKSNNPLFDAALREVAPGRDFELTIRTVPPLPNGTQSARITVPTSDAALAELAIDAVVTVLPAVQVVPQAFTFASARLAAPEKRFAVVLNHRHRTLRVTDVTTNAPGVEHAITVSPDAGQVTITLTFPAGFEPRPGLWVRGKTTDPTLPAFEVPIVAAGRR